MFCTEDKQLHDPMCAAHLPYVRPFTHKLRLRENGHTSMCYGSNYEVNLVERPHHYISRAHIADLQLCDCLHASSNVPRAPDSDLVWGHITIIFVLRPLPEQSEFTLFRSLSLRIWHRAAELQLVSFSRLRNLFDTTRWNKFHLVRIFFEAPTKDSSFAGIRTSP